MKTAKACAKIILFGEHAVVYGKPGIAVPIKKLYTLVTASSESFSYTSDRELSQEEHVRISKLFKLLFDRLNLANRNISIDIESNIPIASGMGSSASLSIAIIKAFSNFFDLKLTNEEINETAFECEKIFHGNPSGIDNTVITYEKPIFFQNKKTEFIELKKPLCLIIANSGNHSNTKDIVSEVREKFEKDKGKYSKLFDEIGDITINARSCLEKGDIKKLGKLMTLNHELLGELGVSNIHLDALVEKALDAGAYGAKLIGAGKGGNIIALSEEKNKEKVINSLKKLKQRSDVDGDIMSFEAFAKGHKKIIDHELESYLNSEIKNLDASFIKDCYIMIKEYTLSGGKRLRPIALIMAFLAAGGKDIKKILPFAISIELYHTYTLILDDIMDEDELRRNSPTVYKKAKTYFLKNFKEEKYEGSLFNKKSNRFAVSYGMMLGNITNIMSKKIMLESDVSDQVKIKAFNCIENADEKIYHGQMMDILMEHSENVSEKQYFEMINLKTAVLFGAAFELGALFADSKGNTFKEFGINTAIAFQIEDDILDILGDKGHEKGSDIKKGKKNLLMIKTLEKASSDQKKTICKIFGNQEASEQDIDKIIKIMQETGAILYCRKVSENYINRAKKNIGSLKLDTYNKEIFSEFSDSVIKRTS